MIKVLNIKDQKRKDLAQKVRKLKTNDFYNILEENNITRAFIIFENGEFILSHHEILKPIKSFLELSQDFSNHEGIFIGRENGIKSLFFAFVHDTRRGLAQGGLRFSKYNSLAELLIDGLRLSQGMTRKNALAGLWWGGGKGIITFPPEIQNTEELKRGSSERNKYFEAYGRFIASLKGIYYTAEDVGTNTEDMNALLSQNRFTTCIAPNIGGSGNPSPYTARGVFRSMQAAWKTISGTDNLKDVKISVQGAGNVGYPLIKYLYESGAKIWFCDMSENRINQIKTEMPEINVVENKNIFDLDVDIFAPCAIGAQVNSETIPKLKVKLICGAANNILKEPETDSLLLKEKGILFVPDFVCNRMGIVNCADEWLGYLEEDKKLASERVYPDTLRVFKYAKNRAVTTMKAAIDLADIAASEIHPMLHHRGRRIIDKLLDENNHKKNKNTELGFTHYLDETEIRIGWERKNLFKGNSYSVSASPISCSSSPDLSSFLSPLLLDVRARSYELLNKEKVKRILGSNHGGLSLQISIEQSLPYEREEIGFSRFNELCKDVHNANDEEIRKQLHHSGIGFPQELWINPISEKGKESVDKLYDFLKSANLLVKQNKLFNYCPHCKTILVSSDIKRNHTTVKERYTLKFVTDNNEIIETKVFFPEYTIGAVAIAIKKDGVYSKIKGKNVLNNATNKKIPIIFSDLINTEAEFIAPIHNPEDEKIAKENNIEEIISIFDENGNVSFNQYENLTREETRIKIIENFKNNQSIEKGNFEADVLKCGRCETILVTKVSEEIFVNIDEGKNLVIRSLETNEISFINNNIKSKIIDYINNLDQWCISRDYWWGNKIKGQRKVFSTWFSLTAITLQSLGWLDNPKPNPINEVFVNADFLYRWIIPTQLITMMVTGKPAFSKIFTHGSIHIVERSLKKIEGVPNNYPDEERFIFKSTKRPMQKRLGNVIEPKTLIKRFGADVLRLAYLLSLGKNYQNEITISQDKINQAKHSLYKFNSKFTNIVLFIKKLDSFTEYKTDYDDNVLKKANQIYGKVKESYKNYDYFESANLFLEMNDLFSNYCNEISNDYKHNKNIGKAKDNLLYLITEIKEIFNPLCPYQYEKLEKWFKRQVLN